MPAKQKHQENNSVSILGAGNSGMALAAHLVSKKYRTTLWNRTPENIKKLLAGSPIECSGTLVGAFKPDLVTTDIEKAMQSSLLIVAVPANAHKDIGRLISPFIRPDHRIILTPGRTFGAVSFGSILNKKNIMIAETQTIIHTCRKINEAAVEIITLKNSVLFSAGRHTSKFYNILPGFMQERFKPVENLLTTSLNNVGMILHCAPLLLNTGWVECPKAIFKYYYDAITPSIASFCEKMDFERIKVAKTVAGTEPMSILDWFSSSYNVSGNSLHQVIRATGAYKTIDAPETLRHRYIFEDVSTGLVPIESLGSLLGVATPHISLIIDLACSLLEHDFRKSGRSLENILNINTNLNINTISDMDKIFDMDKIPDILKILSQGIA